MDALVNSSIQPGTLLESDLLGVAAMLYFLCALFVFVSFINIYSMDEYEFKHNLQSCYEFKRKIPFIIMHSKCKNIISKKTFILEILGFILAILLVVSFIISLWLSLNFSFLLVGICYFIVCFFAVFVACLYRKTTRPRNVKKQKKK